MPPTLHVTDAGTGPPLVLVHGAMDRSGGLARVARHLPDNRVIRYDRRGYARSLALGPADLATHAADLVDLLRAVAVPEPGGRAVVVGHSMGGLVALAAAHARPDLVAAVGAYEPPTPWREEWPPGIERWRGTDEAAADRVIEHAVGAERWARVPASLRADRRAEGAALMAEMRSLVAGPPGALPAGLGPVAVPAVLAHGSESPAHVAVGLAGFARDLGAGTPHVLDGPGHQAPTTHARAYAAWARSLVALRPGVDAPAAASR